MTSRRRVGDAFQTQRWSLLIKLATNLPLRSVPCWDPAVQASESSEQFAREAAQNPHRSDQEVPAQTQLPLPESENGVVGSAM